MQAPSMAERQVPEEDSISNCSPRPCSASSSARRLWIVSMYPANWGLRWRKSRSMRADVHFAAVPMATFSKVFRSSVVPLTCRMKAAMSIRSSSRTTQSGGGMMKLIGSATRL